MNKDFTPTSTLTPTKEKMTARPSSMTIAKIKQFARAYSFSRTQIPSLGGIVAN